MQRGFTGGICRLQWVLGIGVRDWRDRDEDMGGWNRRSWCKILHFVVWDVEGQDEIWRMRRQDYWGIDARHGCVGFCRLAGIVQCSGGGRSYRESWACTIRDTGSGTVGPLVPTQMTDFERVWTRSLAHFRRGTETITIECVSFGNACVETMLGVSVEF